MTILMLFLFWLLAPTVFVFLIACVLSVFFKVPKKPQGGPSWFPDQDEW